jgi:hypothetical protein
MKQQAKMIGVFVLGASSVLLAGGVQQGGENWVAFRMEEEPDSYCGKTRIWRMSQSGRIELSEYRQPYYASTGNGEERIIQGGLRDWIGLDEFGHVDLAFFKAYQAEFNDNASGLKVTAADAAEAKHFIGFRLNEKTGKLE